MKRVLKLGLYSCLLFSFTTSNFGNSSNLNNENIKINKKLLKKTTNQDENCDSYIEQEGLEEIEDNNWDTDDNKQYAIIPTTHEFTDNESDDDRASQAVKVNPEYSNIKGKLHINDFWTQLINRVGEKDEDYFKFTTREKLMYTINFNAPINYHLRILKYCNQLMFLSEVYNTKYIELLPGTYFLHVYTNDKNSITNEEYNISFTSKRVSNLETFELDEINKAKYVAAIWESELIPSNYKRYKNNRTCLYSYQKTRQKTFESGYIDDLFLSKGKKTTDEEFLDYIIYVWDEEIIKQIAKIAEKTYESLKKLKQEENVKEGQLQLVYDGINLIINIFVDGVSKLLTMVSVVEYVSKLFQCIFLNGSYVSIKEDTDSIFEYLTAISISAKNYNDKVLVIPHFYNLEYQNVCSNSKAKIYYYKLINKNYVDGMKYEFLFDIDSINDIQNKYQFFGEAAKSKTENYYGKVIPFKTQTDFKEYIQNGDDTEIENKYGDYHSYDQVDQYNNTNHKLTCSICENVKYEEHIYIYKNNKYYCEKCGYEKELNHDSISTSNYNISNQYNTSVLSSTLKSNSNNNITISYLNCKKQDDYIDLYSNNNEAYIEYKFSEEVIKLDLKVSSVVNILNKSTKNVRLKFYTKDQDGWHFALEKQITNSGCWNEDLAVNLGFPSTEVKISFTTDVEIDAHLKIGNIKFDSVKTPHVHSYTSYSKYNSKYHLANCECGVSFKQVHVVKSTSKKYGNCVLCGQLVDLGSGFVINPVNIKTYIRNDGIIILSREDYIKLKSNQITIEEIYEELGL